MEIKLKETLEEIEELRKYFFEKDFTNAFSYKLAIKVYMANLQKRAVYLTEENVRLLKEATTNLERELNE